MNQHHEQSPARSATDTTPDPIGPVTLPKRSPVGRRALALVGTASVAALAVHAVVDGTTLTTINEHHV
ncbi:hypothetical protein FB561_0998 [Kribbella amoyensis]|uniref:Uncharacterized protein n=1 Tax=Kribbella amoyensis TaxID=996641 RepID=A0A561BM91_9ACTN|nr:hypothetical protein [Kribbella amoyensis]TWD79932.1 hypothetical protein FB561_0998 [Kribbella amoyensis]